MITSDNNKTNNKTSKQTSKQTTNNKQTNKQTICNNWLQQQQQANKQQNKQQNNNKNKTNKKTNNKKKQQNKQQNKHQTKHKTTMLRGVLMFLISFRNEASQLKPYEWYVPTKVHEQEHRRHVEQVLHWVWELKSSSCERLVKRCFWEGQAVLVRPCHNRV